MAEVVKNFVDILRDTYDSIVGIFKVKLAAPADYQQPISLQSALSTSQSWDVTVPAGTSWESDEFSTLEARKVVASFYADGAVTCWVYEKDGEYVIPRGKIVLDGTEEIAQVIEFAPTRPS
ncbi:MAG: hypothetical protein DRQ10_07170, partial [Candidatus Hydrothermota bacterium]